MTENYIPRSPSEFLLPFSRHNGRSQLQGNVTIKEDSLSGFTSSNLSSDDDFQSYSFASDVNYLNGLQRLNSRDEQMMKFLNFEAFQSQNDDSILRKRNTLAVLESLEHHLQNLNDACLSLLLTTDNFLSTREGIFIGWKNLVKSEDHQKTAANAMECKISSPTKALSLGQIEELTCGQEEIDAERWSSTDSASASTENKNQENSSANIIRCSGIKLADFQEKLAVDKIPSFFSGGSLSVCDSIQTRSDEKFEVQFHPLKSLSSRSFKEHGKENNLNEVFEIDQDCRYMSFANSAQVHCKEPQHSAQPNSGIEKSPFTQKRTPAFETSNRQSYLMKPGKRQLSVEKGIECYETWSADQQTGVSLQNKAQNTQKTDSQKTFNRPSYLQLYKKKVQQSACKSNTAQKNPLSSTAYQSRRKSGSGKPLEQKHNSYRGVYEEVLSKYSTSEMISMSKTDRVRPCR